MLEVPIDKILSITDARNSFNKIVEDVESAQDGIYILTKGGSPVVALININYLENLSGDKVSPKEEKTMQTEGQPQPETPSTPPPAGGPMSPSPTPPPPAPGPQPPTSPSPTPGPALPSTGEGELPGPDPSPSPIPPVAGPTPPAGRPWGQQ